ncbi:hypothetical protein [Epilithonimonas xixisoli]|uniref:Uncharacterized protein n=1 Tax=Epilithonimonas xixisoli TaxID=1476462 RepID=A0A4R8I2Z6_9FLAO|nr:hypothetical protein [Epilithonimonas xixisoli]TDX82563.1 hypothetical protein B0I22_2571 [Epilithonimonas xixisoli]
MDKQIQKLALLVKMYLNESKEQLLEDLGSPNKYSNKHIWFYTNYRFLIFQDEIAFIFERDRVVDIVITEYVLWRKVSNIFFYEGQIPEYKVNRLSKKIRKYGNSTTRLQTNLYRYSE